MFLIVRCCDCGHFSVKAETKSPKWACKLCGEKQAQARVFASAAKAADLRPLVQEYNLKRGAYEDTQRQVAVRVQDAIVEAIRETDNAVVDCASVGVNEWEQFVQSNDDDDGDDSESNDDAVKLRTTATVAVDKAPRKRKSANDTNADGNDTNDQTTKSQRLVEPK
jgi:hypothetical protein